LILSPARDFVFCTIHNIQANTPIEIVLAMFEVVREYR
jgi:uroporphyrinogen-III decarboxylase